MKDKGILLDMYQHSLQYFNFNSQNLKLTTASSVGSRRIVGEKLPLDHQCKSNFAQ